MKQYLIAWTKGKYEKEVPSKRHIAEVQCGISPMKQICQAIDRIPDFHPTEPVLYLTKETIDSLGNTKNNLKKMPIEKVADGLTVLGIPVKLASKIPSGII